MVVLSACGAAPPLVITTVDPSAPSVQASGTLAVRERSVLVVSAASMAQLAAAAEVVPGPTPAIAMQATVDGGYDVVTSAVESALLRAGAQPVSQAALAQALLNAEVQASVRGTPTQGETALVQQSIVLGRATSAPLVLAIRSMAVGYSADPIARLGSMASHCREWRVRAAEVGVDLVLVRVEDSAVVWTGRATVRTTDLLPESVTLAAGPGHTDYERDYGAIRVVATGDSRNVCEGSDIPGFTCWEVEDNDCSAGEGVGARPIAATAVEALVERAIAELFADAT